MQYGNFFREFIGQIIQLLLGLSNPNHGQLDVGREFLVAVQFGLEWSELLIKAVQLRLHLDEDVVLKLLSEAVFLKQCVVLFQGSETAEKVIDCWG